MLPRLIMSHQTSRTSTKRLDLNLQDKKSHSFKHARFVAWHPLPIKKHKSHFVPPREAVRLYMVPPRSPLVPQKFKVMDKEGNLYNLSRST